jgi:hypothetical protein
VRADLARLSAEDTRTLEIHLAEAILRLPPAERQALERALGAAASPPTLLGAARDETNGGLPARAAQGEHGAYLALMLVANGVSAALFPAAGSSGIYTTVAGLAAFFLRAPLLALAAVARASYLFYANARREQNTRLLAFAVATLHARDRWGSRPRELRE